MSQEYVDRVSTYLKGLEGVSVGAMPGCAECGWDDPDQEFTDEPWFSWHQCEICKSTLGGNRYPWHGVDPSNAPYLFGPWQGGGKIIHGSCCGDCFCYLNDGTVPEDI